MMDGNDKAVRIEQQGAGWVVLANGQQFHCATEAMAKQLGGVFERTARRRAA